MKFFNGLLKNENGFTFMESLLSLFIFMIISTLLVMFLSTLLFRIYEQSIHPFEWENFVKQTQRELRESTNWVIADEKLTFTMEDRRVATYGKYQKLLRKQVSGLGHEVLLQNISDVKFVAITDGVQLQITDLSGKVFKRNIVDIGNVEVKR